MESVAYQWPAGVTYTLNGIGAAGVMTQWAGGAFDTKRNKLMVWGGGHNGYGGNEIYAFDVDDLAWELLTQPSPTLNSTCVAYNSDGQPSAHHTYGSVEYMPNIDRFMGFGNGCWGGVNGSSDVNALNPETKTWEQFLDINVGAYKQSAYDINTGKAWVKGNSGECYVTVFDPVANSWTRRTDWQGCYTYYTTMEHDPLNNKLVAVGEGKQWMWDISKPGLLTRQDLATTGTSEFYNGSHDGFVYDPVAEKFIGWRGGAQVYTLSLNTMAWEKVAAAGTNTVTPTAPELNGTYGRFRYVPDYNVFVVVNRTNENVYIYKHTDAATAPTWYMEKINESSAIETSGLTGNRFAELKLTVSPNPLKTSTRIKFTGTGNGAAKLSVYNIQGKTVYRKTILENQPHQWNTKNVSAGIYFAKVTTINAASVTRLLVNK